MTDVRGKRVLVVGLARTGLAAARVLHRRGAVLTVTDSRPPSAFRDVIPELAAQKIGLELGFQNVETFLRHELIVVSPGVPWDLEPLRAARERGIPVVAEIEVASWYLSGRLVGVTGTNGKTTTTTLLARMLEASGLPVFVGGNIGVPLISAVDEVTPETILVTELSSFQLEAIRSFRPHVAVLLNLTPNHLDRHASFDDYAKAKARIFSNQTAADYAVLNWDDAKVMGLSATLASRKIFFSRGEELPEGVSLGNGQVRYRVGHLERPLLEPSDVRLRGAFNLENVLAGAAAACVLGADFDAIRDAVREFTGVEHRLELVGQLHGVDFYNDSKATSVDAAAKALSAFERGVHLILGGKDKGSPYAPLGPLVKGRARAVYLIGAAAGRIAEELAGTVELVPSGHLETAVREAFRRARPGDVVLLSPACSSFDQFEDYEHRGRVFKQIVEGLARALEAGEAKKPLRVTPPEPAPPAAAPRAETELVAVQGGKKPLERVYVYEVGAEEMAPGEGAEVREEWVEEEVEPTSPEAPAEEAPAVAAARGEEELLPFEVPVSRSATPAQAGEENKSRGRQGKQQET